MKIRVSHILYCCMAIAVLAALTAIAARSSEKRLQPWNFANVKPGMTERDVLAILGPEPRRLSGDRGYAGRQWGLHLDVGKVRTWHGYEYWIEVVFDRQGLVKTYGWGSLYRRDEETLEEKLDRWFRR